MPIDWRTVLDRYWFQLESDTRAALRVVKKDLRRCGWSDEDKFKELFLRIASARYEFVPTPSYPNYLMKISTKMTELNLVFQHLLFPTESLLAMSNSFHRNLRRNFSESVNQLKVMWMQ